MAILFSQTRNFPLQVKVDINEIGHSSIPAFMVLNCVNSRNAISVICMENEVIKIGKVSRENTMHSRKQWRRQILMSPER